MSISIRPYPTLTGKDAEKFLQRQEENKKALEERVQKELKKLQKLQDKE